MSRNRPLATLSGLIVALVVVHPVPDGARASQAPTTPGEGRTDPGRQPPLAEPLPPVEAQPAPATDPDPLAAPIRQPSARPSRAPGRPQTGTGPAATVDPQARPASETAPEPDDKGPLPPAAARPGDGTPRPAPGEMPKDGYAIPAERIPLGRQTIGLSVEVVAPAVMNLHQVYTIRFFVKNTGVADAVAVRVNYNLPRELQLVNAQPQEQRIAPTDPGLQWVLNTVAAGSEQVITLKVKPVEVNPVDHAALVTLMVGGRSRTVIQEPKLAVEQTVRPAKVLKGKQVEFRIAVTNPGSGPARNVLVRAKLSAGLKSEGENIVEQTIAVLQPKERIELVPLYVDTLAGGEQTCTVTAESPDVALPTDDAKVVRSVTVLRPDLGLTLTGPETRYTDTLADYRLSVENPGTAAARDVGVTVTLPANSGRLQKPLPAGARWDPKTQKLTWTIPNIEPGAKSAATIRVLMGGIGQYKVNAEARAGDLYKAERVSTSVSGMADVEMEVSERKRVLDVGETTIFDIRMKNIGTKAAKNLLVRAKISPNMKITNTAGTDAEASIDPANDELVFPQVAGLAPGETLGLSIEVKALKEGPASCRAFLLHDDLSDKMEDYAQTKVTGASGPRNR